MQVTLVMYRADGARRDFPLNKPRVLIGRHNTCELRVPLPSVSRKHCELKTSSGSVKLRDLGSSNGTYINGIRVKAETPLSPGDRIQVGAVIFTVVIDGVPASLEPTDTLMAAQAMAERDKGAGPPQAKSRKPRDGEAENSGDAKTTVKQPAKPEPASAASDELDALLSEIGDDLLDRSNAAAPEDSGAAVELIPDDDDEDMPQPSSAEVDEQISGSASSPEPSEVDDMLADIEDQIAADDAQRESKLAIDDDDDDQADDELLPDDLVMEEAATDDIPELGDSDEIDIPATEEPQPAPQASKVSGKKKKKKAPPADDVDPISALEAMADGSDDSDIDLSWLDDDAH